MSDLRSELVMRRTYNRPTNEEGTQFETKAQTLDRVIGHQEWLWERAKGKKLNSQEKQELSNLREIMDSRRGSLAGRTLWLGGTEVSRRREASQFNCAFSKVETVHDIVDGTWLLLQGCGFGFKAVSGTLNGFTKYIPNVKVIRSDRTDKGGSDFNLESWDADTKTWTIRVGDSSEAWSKAVAKIVVGKYPADTLVFDFSQIRPAGSRLSGYGWISSGDEQMAEAFTNIARLMNRRAGQILTEIDILDIMNLIGTMMSSRRPAEIALLDYGSQNWEAFARAKNMYYEHSPWRGQSNNSLMFWDKPMMSDLKKVLNIMVESGGSEPGIINAQEALRRAPYFSGVNPCAEILLANKSFCNLTELNLAAFSNDSLGTMHESIRLLARANYRQTLVNLEDGVLQRAWHENQEFLRLCGVGLTGIAQRPDLTPYDYHMLRNMATYGAYSMADELGMQRPKNVTTIKPSGTLSKVMNCTEGLHKPLGRYIFNNVYFSRHDPLVKRLIEANYNVFDHPTDSNGCLVTLPVEWGAVPFSTVNGVHVNDDTAISQLDRYKLVQNNYVDNNASVTISYSPDEIDSISEWLQKNWESYVGVSFIFRTDPTKTAKDLGFPYLPQEVVDRETYDVYTRGLKPVDLDGVSSLDELEDDCVGGVCPVR